MKLPFTSGLLVGAALVAAIFDQPIITAIAMPTGFALGFLALVVRRK